MAKKTNIVRIIKEEIKKGNTYVATNGNFVSADMLEREILADFKRDLDANPEVVAIPFDQYKANALAGYTTSAELLDGICEAFNLVNDDPANAEEAAPDQTALELPEPDSEPSEAVQSDSEPVPDKPKRGKSKAGEAK